MVDYDTMVRIAIKDALNLLPQNQIDFFNRIISDSPYKTLDKVPGSELKSYYDLVYRSVIKLNKT